MNGNDRGYIKLFRKVKYWKYKTDPNYFAFFMHCIIEANISDGNYKGVDYKRGEFITTYNSLSKDTGLSLQQLRTIIKHLTESGEISTRFERGKKYNIIRVCKYDEYQLQQFSNDVSTNYQRGGNNVSTNYQQTSNELATIDKEDRSIEERRKEYMCGSTEASKQTDSSRFHKPTLGEVIDFANTEHLHINATDFFNYYEARGWILSGGMKCQDWKALIKTWKDIDSDTSTTNEQPYYTDDELKAMGFVVG